MGFTGFYLLALIPMMVGGILWLLDRRIVWLEWLAGSVSALLIASIIHMFVAHGIVDDVETWSGHLTSLHQYSEWEEYYEYAVYRTEYTTESYTDSNGHRQTRTVSHEVFDHWEPTTRWHHARWTAHSNIDTNYDISEQFFNRTHMRFRDLHPVPGIRRTSEHNSKMIRGDPNDYESQNKTGWIEPVTKLVHFVNRVKASPSVFSYVQPPPNTVFEYPGNTDPFSSDRLLGTAAALGTREWDQMNARLNPKTKVNVIAVGFGAKGSEYSQMQEARWVGGKKNDVVITFGGPNKHPTWVRVFGWTEHDVMKRNLESIVLTAGITTDTIPLIEAEIRANYMLKDWSKFDYLSLEPPAWSYWVLFAVMVVTQGAFWTYAFLNDLNKR